MRQADIFLESEGNAWHARNRDKPRLPGDPVIEIMRELELRPKAVLELGCGNGWRLAEIERLWPGSFLAGIEPSAEAVKERVHPNVQQLDALSGLSHIKHRFYNLVIFGFCLYLIDREDLMMIVAHTDRVLQDGGHIIIHDFIDKPHKVAYKHKEGVWSYHMDHSDLWFGHPGYQLINRRKDENNIGVVVLRKDFANAFPERMI